VPRTSIPKPVAIGLGIVVAVTVSLAAISLLIRSAIEHEGLFLVLCAAALILPLLVVLWVFYPATVRDVFESSRIATPPNDGSWIDIGGDHETGYTLTGDQNALRRIGAECLRLADVGKDGDQTSMNLAEAELQIARRDAHPGPSPYTWSDRLSAFGCTVLVLMALACLIRGCVALQHDVQRWLQ
jgi:hypothetical protein